MKRFFALFLLLLVAAILIAPTVDLDPTVVAGSEGVVLLLLAGGILMATALHFTTARSLRSVAGALCPVGARVAADFACLLPLTCRLRR